MKKKLKNAVLLFILLSMTLSLCGCGGSDSEPGSVSSGSQAGKASGSSSTTSPAQTSASSDPSGKSGSAAKDNAASAASSAYKATFTGLNGDRDISYMTARYWTDSGVYCTGDKIVGTRAPADAEPQYYGQFDVTEGTVYFISYDGTVQELENYMPVNLPTTPYDVELGTGTAGEAAEDPASAESADVSEITSVSDGTADQQTIPSGASSVSDAGYTSEHPCEGVYQYSAISYSSSLNALPDGNLFLCDGIYLSWTDTEELDWNDENYYDHYNYKQYIYLRTLDLSGKELSSYGMEIPSSEWMYTDGYTDTDGNILFVRSSESGEYFVTAISPVTGETAYEIKMEDSVSGIYRVPDGTVYALSWGNDGNQLLKLDPATRTFGSPAALPGEAYTLTVGGGEYPFYYTSGVYCYGFDPASGEDGVKLFSWMDCDVDADSASYGMTVDSTGIVRTLVSDYDAYTMTYDRSLAVIQKTEADPSVQKQELTLATQYLSYELRNAVVSFNRKSDTARIVVRDYSEYNTEDDYSAGLTKLQTEIMAGNCPDIIDLSGLNLSQLASKGVLEDLYPYLESDPELSRDQFYSNVLAAAEKDGKLMHTVTYFTINTVVGASGIVGDEPGWTYEELENALLDMPEGCSPFDVSTTRDTILNTCLNLDMGDFVNWSTGEVSFDNEEFVSLLKFAADFPESYDWETYDWASDSAETRIAEGRQMLYAACISGTDTLNYIEAMYNGTPVTFIGYPTSSGTGNTIEVDTGYAMSSTCSDKEAAWQFLRTFFTASSYENGSYYGMPARKDLLEKKLKKACTPTYEIDEKGEYKLDANGEKIPEEHYYQFNSMAYTYYALSQDLADRFMNLLNTTTRVSVIDESIKEIVNKHAASFFSGQKSAEEVAKLVQSNAMIYVNEQR